MNKVYMCIDLKSFYASVECRERGLDPLTTNLVVADESRTEKTICLAVSPSLKAYGLGGRCRLFEAVAKVREFNSERRKKNNNRRFISKSYNDLEVRNNPLVELDFIRAVPRMKLYMKYSTDIYNIYLKYIAPEDILVYSIDEVFCDITGYLNTYNMSAEDLVKKMIYDVYSTTGITATAGIGTNMYLAKVAMDITAKHMEPNEYGVRVAYLDEKKYRKELWNHKPLTDFWRVGRGYVKKLNAYGMYTMGDVARMSIDNEDLLFKLFGVNAEFLIDHAWGYEPCTIKDAKSYKPARNSISSGQVLHRPYSNKMAKLIVNEMCDLLVLDLVRKNVVTNQIVLTIGYDIENLKNENTASRYNGEVTIDYYGRSVPKAAHGTVNLDHYSASSKIISDAVNRLYDRITNPILTIRRVNIAACNIISNDNYSEKKHNEQLDLFSDYEEVEKKRKQEKIREIDDIKVEKTILNIQNKYGKNAILKGMNLEEGATTRERNESVGGHKG